jgi:hypothetical protein
MGGINFLGKDLTVGYTKRASLYMAGPIIKPCDLWKYDFYHLAFSFSVDI